MNIIEVKDLNKKFVNGKQEAHILKNINLTVEKGEFVSISQQQAVSRLKEQTLVLYPISSYVR